MTRGGCRGAFAGSVLAALVALILPGCSFMFVGGPSSTPERVYPSCTDARTMPLIDGLLTTIYIGAGVLALSGQGHEREDDSGELLRGAIAGSRAPNEASAVFPHRPRAMPV